MATAERTTPLDLLRADFPALDQEIRPGVRLTYLDNAATTLKPWPVIRAVQAFDAEYPANVHRGIHALSERATEAYELARAKVARFIGAEDPEQVIWTRGTTESINLVAQSWGRAFLKEGDEVVLSDLEHHANLVPWQMLAKERGLTLRFAEITEDGRLEPEAVERVMTDRTRVVAISAMSNVLGTVVPLEPIVAMAHERGAIVVVDGAQGVPHRAIDVSAIGADFLAFSGHKMCGPTGVGVLYGKREHLEAMPPAWGGGSMVMRVTRESSEWNDLPYKFEPGTPPIAQAIGLGAAVDYLSKLDSGAVAAHERGLMEHAHRRLSAIEGVRILGPSPEHKGGIVGMDVEGVHPHDLAQLLDREGVAIRAGQHCAMPLHQKLGLAASGRASAYLYNTTEDVDRLADAVDRARHLFKDRRPRR
ncbi:aminotransferase class V-fold PLP-dependent enzyme [Tautonia plasticadhaerens]|uniref:cysteine desulfurase n=1 Tax=Tautonia plasticadhaerens TaxID=2527974 RepID=A0A518GXK9_9BACT|nr:cysteine desulfurase [Tautonia plasticadhaerens]QDV33292.1 putative cysteine desulfurase [Tautonia plasticadhaerens]